MLQKNIKIIIKASKVSKRNMNKSLSIVRKFMKMLKIVFLKTLTDREKSISEMISWSNMFCCLGRFSSVVELFIDFLTSGLSFVKNCWGLILWCSGGPLCFIFICQVNWEVFEIFVL